MQQPSVVHPVKIKINGIFLEIVAYCSLTDLQARNAAFFAYSCLSKKARKKRGGDY